MALVTRRHFDRVRCKRRPADMDVSGDDGSGSIDVVAGGWSRGWAVRDAPCLLHSR